MSWRTILLLGVTALLLSVLLLLEGRRGAGDGATGGRLFSALEGGAVYQIQLSRPEEGSQVRLKRADDGWRMLLPVKDRGDRAQVEALLAGVEFMRPLRWLPAGDPPSGSGLDKPTIKLILTSGGGDHELAVGAADASGQGAYVRLEQGGKVRLAVAPMRLLQLLDLAPGAFRDHLLVPLSPAQIQRVELRGSAGAVTLKRQGAPGLSWIAEVQGRSCRASGQRLRRLLNALSALRGSSIGPATGASAHPWIQISGAGEKIVILEQAGPCPGRGDQVLLYVQERQGTSAQRTVSACLDQQQAALLSPAPGTLQDLALTRWSEPELEEIAIWTPAQDVRLVRTPSGWTRQGKPFDGLLVRALSERLQDTQGRLTPRRWEGAAPSARLRLKAELGGAEELVLFTGPDGLLFVQRAGDNADLRLEPDAARPVWDGIQLMGR